MKSSAHVSREQYAGILFLVIMVSFPLIATLLEHYDSTHAMAIYGSYKGYDKMENLGTWGGVAWTMVGASILRFASYCRRAWVFLKVNNLT